jgi:hypothetical protein
MRTIKISTKDGSRLRKIRPKDAQVEGENSVLYAHQSTSQCAKSGLRADIRYYRLVQRI